MSARTQTCPAWCTDAPHYRSALDGHVQLVTHRAKLHNVPGRIAVELTRTDLVTPTRAVIGAPAINLVVQGIWTSLEAQLNRELAVDISGALIVAASALEAA